MKRNVILWLCLTTVGLFTWCYWAFGYHATVFVLASILMGLAIGVFINWTTTAIEAVKNGGQGWALLGFALIMVATFAIYQRSLALIRLRWPNWMDETPLLAFSPVFLIIAFSAVLLAPGLQGGAVPKRNWVYLVGAGFIGGLFLGVTIAVALMPAEATVEPANYRYLNPLKNSPRLTCGDDRPILVNAYCRKASPT